MKKLKLILLLLFFGICLGPIWADGDSTRIAALQKEVNSLRDSLAAYQKSSAQVVQLLTEAKKAAAEPWSTLLWKGGLLLVLAAALFLGFWWLLNKVAPDWHMKIIQRLVERYEEVNLLKREKRILRLNIDSADAENRRLVGNILKEFKVVEEINIKDAYIAPTKEFDVVFANFEKGFEANKHQAILQQYISSEQHFGTTLFALVPPPPNGWNFTLKPELNGKVSIANVRAQIYGNLISMLKYHSLTNSKW